MTILQQIDASASPEVQMNENFETIEFYAVYGKRQPVTVGLTWGYYGGRWGGFAVANGTLALTNAVNYLVILRSNGVISVSAVSTNWDNTVLYARAYKITASGGLVTVVEDHRAGPAGVHGAPDSVNFTDNATPTGTINGTDGTDGNAVFTLAQAPLPAASLQLYKTDVGTGVLMIATVHYNLSGLTITYTAGNIPIAAMIHRAWYRY